MADVTIRNLDDEVLKALEVQARTHNHSLEEQLRQILIEAVDLPRKRKAFLQEAQRIREMTPAHRSQSNSVDLLREDRDR